MKNYSNLIQRIITAGMAVPLMLLAIYSHVGSYFCLFALLQCLVLHEFYQLVNTRLPMPLWLRYAGLGIGLLLNGWFFLYEQAFVSITSAYLFLPVLTLIYIVQLYQKHDTRPFHRLAYMLLGLVYGSLPFAMLHAVAFYQGTYRYEIVMGLFFLIWAYDTGAYFVGKNLGKNSLFRRISPKKSWEGCVGGAAVALLVGAVIAHYWPIFSFLQWQLLTVVIVVTGTYGDLVASRLKRSYGIKDSGNTIPGHGGFLDRFDSFMMAIIWIAMVIKVCYS